MQNETNTAMNYIVTNPAAFARVATFDIEKVGRHTNILLCTYDGDVIESEGEHGPNDFADYGIKLTK